MCVGGISEYLLSVINRNLPSVCCSDMEGHSGISLKPTSFGCSHISVYACTVLGAGGELSLHFGM